eukprot:TRINITY_DN1533_c0_g1_i2.p1 TRINITY_DN1533_c0_g1~~TRINITY_DN1533_c0_g1_i2.p1  ORF type:complete len:562 (+),score=174.17 TRINITY_DN1533_c0_g1_i2:79-1764(+)
MDNNSKPPKIELLKKVFKSKGKLNTNTKGEWIGSILTEYPHILEMRERTRMFLDNNKELEELILNGKTSRGVISHEVVIDLILKYLRENGFYETYERIRNETKLVEMDNYLGEGQLESLIDCGLTKLDSKDLFNIPEEKEDIIESYNYLSNSFMEEVDENVWEVYIKKEEININQKGSFNQIIIEMVVHTELMEIFLEVYQGFAYSTSLLHKLLQFFLGSSSTSEKQTNEGISTNIQEKHSEIQKKIIAVIEYWIEKFPHEWDEKLSSQLIKFTNEMINKDLCSEQMKSLQGKLHHKKEISKNIDKKVNYSDPIVPKNIFSPQLRLEDIDVVEVARQITLIDFSIFSQISLGDILSKEWRDQERVPPKVQDLTERSNSFSSWVITSILSIFDVVERVKLVVYFIKLLSELNKINNFFSAFSLFGALSSTPIVRLKDTLKQVPEEYIKIFEQFSEDFSLAGNHFNYRRKSSTLKPPAIPFFQIHFQDIYFYLFSLPDTIDGLINTSKLIQSRVLYLTYFRKFNKSPFPFYSIFQIQTFLKDWDSLMTREEMLKRSFMLESDN